MNKYPFAKVVSTFLLSPFVGGTIFGAIALLPNRNAIDLLSVDQGTALDILQFYYVWIFMVASVALVYQFAPALVLALICVSMELHKSMISYFCVSVGGGLLAFFWTGITNNSPFGLAVNAVNRGFPLWNLPAKNLILGALCALLAAIFSLPQKYDFSGKVKGEYN